MGELPEWAKSYNRELKKNKRMQELGKRIGYDPLCGTITTEMAIAALQGEQLGKGDVTDMLCVSYSQTDVIGHEWGTRGEHTDGAYPLGFGGVRDFVLRRIIRLCGICFRIN